ncbi:MAG: hypothetical protein ACOCZD_01345 [Haloferacaceae archaeon]
MSDWTERVRQLAPHWAVMFLLMIGVLAVIEAYVMELSFWQSLVVVFAIGLGYPPVVRRLGVAPPVWQRQ